VPIFIEELIQGIEMLDEFARDRENDATNGQFVKTPAWVLAKRSRETQCKNLNHKSEAVPSGHSLAVRCCFFLPGAKLPYR